MPSERWRQIEDIFHAAREREPALRPAFLDNACGDDWDLRRSVEALLRQDAQGGALLSEPMEKIADDVLENDAVETDFPPGSMLGPYRIGARLGAGGMGQVYLAQDTRLQRAVAIKTLKARFTDRFQREARAISALNHPHICTLYDIGSQDGAGYLVMEYLDGQPLKGPLKAPEALRLAIQIAGALEAAHEQGILHRDLKPGNILVSKSGVKLLDFGLAKFTREESRPVDVTVTASLTVTGQILGTVAYMSPEQVEGNALDARSDIFSFGLVLYELLAGRRAFQASSQNGLMAAILKEDPAPLATLQSSAPEALIRTLNKCLEKDPARRWQTVADLRHELEWIAEGGSAPPRRAFLPWTIAGAAVILLVCVAGYFYLHRPRKLTDQDTIVLADFINTTQDPVFDGTLRQGLAIQLEQSPFLKIMDDPQVQQQLRLMSVPPGARITNSIAHDVCVRAGAAAAIGGSIEPLGKSYVVTLLASNCQGGATLAREQVQVPDKEQVLSALGSAATAMRAKLGESLSSIRNFNRPLEQATTYSLEALQNFTAAFTAMGHGRFLDAMPSFERATALDPNFATAYFYLGLAADNAGDELAARENIGKAFALIDRVSEREREQIVAGHYKTTGELDKSINTFQLAIGNYPRDWGFHNDLGVAYIDLGRFEEGLKEGLEAARLQPLVESPYRRLLDAYMCLDRMAEAAALEKKMQANHAFGARIHQRFLEMAYVEDDRAAVARETQWFAGKPEEYFSFGLQAADRNAHGQLGEAAKLYRRAAETAVRQGLRSAAAEFDEAGARADALAGGCQTVRRLGRPPDALAMCGEAATAEKLAAETTQRLPNAIIWNAVQLPAIRAAIEIKRGQAAKAVDLLASASPYERAYPEAVYLRGWAYLGLHQGAAAATEFRKILDHKGASWGSTWRNPNWGLYYSISYVGLARGAALAGDTVKARKAYDDFFALWKEADQDLPILIEARKEYAALR